jgi:hypothetical protein
MKFSFAYVKQHPYLFGGIVLVFGLGLWLVLNRGAGAPSSGGYVVANGKSDNQAALEAQVAIAGMQLQAQQVQAQAQIAGLAQQGQNDLALANLQSQVALASLSSQERTDKLTLDASTLALQLQLDNALKITDSNNQFMVDYARTAADAAVEQLRINAALQTTLSGQQLEAYKTSSLLSIVPTLKKGDRDNALISLALGAPSSHGSVLAPPKPGAILTNPPLAIPDFNAVGTA